MTALPATIPAATPPSALLASARAHAAAHGARPYQEEMVLAALAHLESPPSVGVEPVHGRRSRSVLLQAPTGAGKTFTGLLAAAVMQNEFGLTVGWCAARRELLRQAREEIAKFGLTLDLELISMFDRTPPAVDLLVVDEAHHDGAMSMATLHACINPGFVIGLTATPFRRDRVKLCFERTVRSCTIQSLVDQGYLSRYAHFMLDDWRPQAVAQAYASERGRWGQSLIFFRTEAESRVCVEALRNQGVRVELVTGSSNREAQIDGFERRSVDVLVSMNVLTEGFDCPSLQTVFCRPSSRLPTVQMCGRVFRKHPGIALKQIVQSRDTELPFARFVRPVEQHLWTDAGWRALGATRALDAFVEENRRKIAQATVMLPKLFERGRRRARAVRGGGGPAAA